MKITLYMAISIDGYVAKKDGDSDWVSEIDTKNFEREIKEKGCIILGRRTFKQYEGELYPVKDVTNIVLTTNSSIENSYPNVIYVNSPKEAIETATNKGHDEALLIGGGTTNGLFFKEGLIDEVILSVHPLILGDGIKLFEDVEKMLELQLLNTEEIGNGIIQLVYKAK